MGDSRRLVQESWQASLEREREGGEKKRETLALNKSVQAATTQQSPHSPIPPPAAAKLIEFIFSSCSSPRPIPAQTKLHLRPAGHEQTLKLAIASKMHATYTAVQLIFYRNRR